MISLFIHGEVRIYLSILNFEKNILQSLTIIRLEQNYRSTQNILSCASSLIANNNTGRYGKRIMELKMEIGEKTSISEDFGKLKRRHYYVSDEIEKLNFEKGYPLNEIAILLRVSAHSRSFEERFITLLDFHIRL